ncbi:MAG: fasciclin domain-containing protein [bacterium]
MRTRSLLTLAIVSLLAAPLSAQEVMVGGEAMYPAKDIVSNAVNSKDHTTLVAAVKAAGLVETLQGKGPFTVFAPINGAFAVLPAGTVETLLKPESKSALTGVLTYHVLAGRYTAKDIKAAIKKGHGTATFTTVNGQKLTAMMNGPLNVVLKDAKGGVANISTYDVRQSNGVIHVIDHVLLPSM